MVQQGGDKTVTAIVAAYNEHDRIGIVLRVLTTYPGFKEVIVVDDGSTDNTAEVVAQYPVTYIKNETNMGKGYSMDQGVAAAATEVVFFADADTTGLTHQMLDEIITPVLSGDMDMSVAMRSRKIYYMHFILALTPLLGGERAVRRSLWMKVPKIYKKRFEIESALNFYACYYGSGFGYSVFPGLG